MGIRKVESIIKSKPVIEGAGVHLKRAFSNNLASRLDPFLLLDDFHSSNPNEYIKGFPWHPHRGIETITYILHGAVEHGDSMGNKGVISSGDLQWMTSGSGIVHQEMPIDQKGGAMWGFQLWANLPSSHKMMEPRYRDIRHDMIPEVMLDNGVKVKIICGEVNGVKGPVEDIITDPEYLDITIPAGNSFAHDVQPGYTLFAYVIAGNGCFEPRKAIEPENLVIFSDGDRLEVTTPEDGVRFLLLSGKPIKESIAWAGPIVMNTQEELQVAFEEYRNGTFLQH